VAAGTVVAFLISLFRPLVKPAGERVEPYLKLLRLPTHALTQSCLVLLSLLLIALLSKLPKRISRSWKLGLIPFPDWLLVSSVVIFWVALESGYAALAWGSIGFMVLMTAADVLIALSSAKVDRSPLGLVESDLPVQEGGEDLLGRREIIEGLVSAIVLEQPEVIAVTGAYGEGKTSFLNLTVGELKKVEEDDLPVIVRFSPWLAADSNALVLSLLNSIVVEMKKTFVLPGMGRDAARYARTLLSAVPRAEWLKDFITDPSQEQRIDALADHIGRTRRRVLVVLDDLDRMEAKELETVFKLLRGSDRLSNITFLCAFAPSELAQILNATRPSQNTATFIEKFFPVQYALPRIDPSQLRDLFSQRIASVVARFSPSHHDDMSKMIESIWEGGASSYFGNLRRIKLFLNAISRSLERIAHEVNIEDFIRLELIRYIEPNLYEQIFRNPERFWNQDFAFEVSFTRRETFGEENAKKWRAEFYKEIEASVPAEKQYVFQLLENLFPYFAAYRKRVTTENVQPVEAEKRRRICHPRYFAQYFTLKTPSNLFPQREFDEFLSSVRNLGEDQAAEEFDKKFRSFAEADFKRWHFMHLIENEFESFKLDAQRGLCRGMAQNSALWQVDAFQLMIAITCTRETLGNIAESDRRQEFLRAIVRESGSDLYTLILIRRMEYDLENEPSSLPEGVRYRAIGLGSGEADTSLKLLSDLREVKTFVTDHLRARYLGPDAPSVFEQYRSLGSGANRIEPNVFLFNWQNLGADAQADQREYLRGLLAKRPQDLNEFLKLMFRVAFIDDYSQLKPLIDYKDLSELITRNESIVDADKVEQFRERYYAEQESAPPSQPSVA
jgi:hypothetical protein